jgi:uncharacterized protein YjdB
VDPTTGVITAVDSGTTTITATVEGQSANFVITVSLVPAATVTVSGATATDSTGQTRNFTAVLQDAASNILTGRAIVWTSTNTSRLTIDPTTGVATLLDSGTVDVVATTTPGTGGGGTAVGSQTVTIVLTPVGNVAAPGAHNTGNGLSYGVTVRDTRNGAAANRSCVLTSGDTNIITVPPTATTTAAGILVVNLSTVGMNIGSTTVTANCEGVTGQTVVNVP